MLENLTLQQMKHLGREARRSEALDKLTGAATYVSDMVLPGMLYALVKKPKKPKKQTVGDALRRFRDAVVAEGEAFSRRIEESDKERRLKRATGARRGGTATGSGRAKIVVKRRATVKKRAR